MTRSLLLTIAIIGASLAAGLACLPFLPDEMVVHWNFWNQPDACAPKALAVILLPLASAIVLAPAGVFWGLSRTIGDPAAKRALRLAGAGLPLSLAGLLAYTQGLMLAWNLGARFPLGWFLLPALAAALGIMLLTLLPLMRLEWVASREAAKKSPGIWFAAKRYGWGWGLPCAWQGWVALVVWFSLFPSGLFGIISALPEGWRLGAIAAFAALMIAALFGLCLWKGEKPSWRWGR